MSSVGTQTYGRVKTVKRVPIVTQFLIFHQLPIFPLQSAYDLSYVRTQDVPFNAQSGDTPINGLTLSRIDFTSVLIAYARYFFGGLAVLGGLVSGILTAGVLTGQEVDGVGLTILKVFAVIFAVGIAGTVLTYWLPLLSSRDRKIRERCSELLVIAIDPARISASDCVSISQFMAKNSQTLDQRAQLIAALVSARIAIANDQNVAQMERETDKLLNQL